MGCLRLRGAAEPLMFVGLLDAKFCCLGFSISIQHSAVQLQIGSVSTSAPRWAKSYMTRHGSSGAKAGSNPMSRHSLPV